MYSRAIKQQNDSGDNYLHDFMATFFITQRIMFYKLKMGYFKENILFISYLTPATSSTN